MTSGNGEFYVKAGGLPAVFVRGVCNRIQVQTIQLILDMLSFVVYTTHLQHLAWAILCNYRQVAASLFSEDPCVPCPSMAPHGTTTQAALIE